MNIGIVLLILVAAPVFAGPVEFGMGVFNRALEARGIAPQRFQIQTEITADPPESYKVEPHRVSGGDLRGLMYGLLEAADQIREYGYLVPAKGTAATPIRGIRIFLHNAELEKDWYYSRDYWNDFFAMLARDRFNRFNLVFAHQTNYLAPPYPFWIGLKEFPGIRASALTEATRDRNLAMLQFISQAAADHAIDFTLGIWEHNIQTKMTPTVEGLTQDNIGPYSYAALKTILAACPAIRSVQMRTNAESGIPKERQVEFYRDYVYRAIRESGRRVVLDLRGWVMGAGMMDAAKNAGVPLRLSSKYWAEDMGRPYQPGETFPNYSFLNFLEKPRSYEFYFEIWALGSHRLLLWGDPDFVRRAVPTFGLAGSAGFEIDPPLAQKGFGNRPGQWGVFTPEQKDRVFWKHEFERYWLFYALWGRLSYDPKAAEKIWTAELARRFGPAAPDVLKAYHSASGVLSEIVATHLADPNMYVWPEINPGGLIDEYIKVRPSDWRTIATIPEAVANRIHGVASAKQTPADTARRLDQLASETEEAVTRAGAKMAAGNREWKSSEPDFRVLAMMARYHARKMVAADQLEYFYQTGDAAALAAAKQELTAALGIWEKLAQFTDGLYPREMAFGPDDVGHWIDKLPYVRHDLKVIEERERILAQFGKFNFGFDFGGPVAEPRFVPVDVKTRYDAKRGYGWITDSPRTATKLTPTPKLELRSVAKDPSQLPQNLLFGELDRRPRPADLSRQGRGRRLPGRVPPPGPHDLRAIRHRAEWRSGRGLPRGRLVHLRPGDQEREAPGGDRPPVCRSAGRRPAATAQIRTHPA